MVSVVRRKSTKEDLEDEGNIEDNSDSIQKPNLATRIKQYFMQSKNDDGMTFKARLAKMGVATVLSYGMISNLSYAILIALSWFTFSSKVSADQLPMLRFTSMVWKFFNIMLNPRLVPHLLRQGSGSPFLASTPASGSSTMSSDHFVLVCRLRWLPHWTGWFSFFKADSMSPRHLPSLLQSFLSMSLVPSC